MARHRGPAYKHPPRWLRVRVPVVVAEGCVEKVGSVTVPVPRAVPRRADGGLAAAIRAVPAGPAVSRVTALHGKVLNEGRLPVDLVVEQPDPEPCPEAWTALRQRVEVPFAALLDLPGVRPGDAVHETLPVEGLQATVVFAPVAGRPEPKPTPVPQVRIAAVIRACFRVERDEVIAIRADP